MAQRTPHYNLVVPELSDAADVSVLSDAVTAMDEAVYNALEGETGALQTALGDLGGQSVEDALDAFAEQVPTLVTSAIGDNVEQAVEDYMDEHGLAVDVSNVPGAVSGVSVNGGTVVTPASGEHTVALSGLVTSVNSITPVNGNVTIDTGAGAIKSINTTIIPDANGNVDLDLGSGTVTGVVVNNTVYEPDATTHRVSLPVVTSVNGHSATSSSGAVTINTGVVQLAFSATISSSTVTLLDSGSGYYHYSVPVGSVTVSGTSYTLTANDIAVLAPNESGFTNAAAVESFRDIFSDLWGAETGAGVLKFYLPYTAPNTSLPVLLKVVRSV